MKTLFYNILLILFCFSASVRAQASEEHAAAPAGAAAEVEDTPQAQIEIFAGSLKTKVLLQLNTMLASRKSLLACVSHMDNDVCRGKVEVMQMILTDSLKRLRLALAFPVISTLDPRDRSISAHIALPANLGHRPLQVLSDEEMTLARKMQAESLEYMDRFAASTSPEQNALPGKMSPDRVYLRAQCKNQDPDVFEKCQAYQAYLNDIFVKFHRDMNTIAADIIGKNPLGSQFDKLPITAKDLESKLTVSTATLASWVHELESGSHTQDEELILAYPRLVSSILAERPELKNAVTPFVKSLRTKERVKKWTLVAGKVIVATGTCIFSEGLLCAVVGGTLTMENSYEAYRSWYNTTERYMAMDSAEILLTYAQMNEQYNDLIVNVMSSTILATVVWSGAVKTVVYSVESHGTKAALKRFISEVKGPHEKSVLRELRSQATDESKDQIREAVSLKIFSTETRGLGVLYRSLKQLASSEEGMALEGA